MPLVRWPADAKGRYWLDVALGNLEFILMIDLGLVDARKQVGFSLEADVYDQLKSSNQFFQTRKQFPRDASGRRSEVESGLIPAQLIDPISRRRVGPLVYLYALRGTPGVPNRVGVEFFHHLTGCRVIWDLDKRNWGIEYP